MSDKNDAIRLMNDADDILREIAWHWNSSCEYCLRCGCTPEEGHADTCEVGVVGKNVDALNKRVGVTP